MNRPIPRHEQGAALINVLVLVGVLAALSTSLFDRLRLARHLDATRAGLEVARGAALAGEAMILARLPLPQLPARAFALPTPAGTATVTLTPGGNCLNLNGVAVGPPGRTITRPLGVEQLARLLTVLDVPQAEAQRIAAATADWVDVDQQPGSGGAEDPAYARAATPYRTAGTLLAEVSEWRAVAGVTPAIFARAAPHLCALPEAELSRPNINSLVAQDAPEIAAIAAVPLASARDVIAARPAGGWRDISSFWAHPALSGRQIAADALRQPDTRDRFVAFRMTTIMADVTLAETGLVDAGKAPARLILRRWGDET
ncbi:type II secretion system minor pseudopilin GspK [Sandarakinorhabdus sp.]|uniref:type II secretion system minor pseudopilin GspK n=1 Tax=Sandarakinorhabdus sp. TaxID=1916663 RepID=UPI00286D8E39|nr:type II secretion system minor pseudopilin GspK [Sandarakinorhabdus sp.]